MNKKLNLKTIPWFLAIAAVFLSINTLSEEDEYSPDYLYKKYPDYGVTWMYMPDGNNQPVKVYLKPPSGRVSTDVEDYLTSVTFRLFTKKNPVDPQYLEVDNVTLLEQSNFDVNKPTKFITHGWLSSGVSESCQSLKDAYLEARDYNIIVVDWESIAGSMFYYTPMMRTEPVGVYYASMIDFLVSQGMDLKQTHLIGHSLGSHVSGYAGAAVKSGKVGRITALDPALPGFSMGVDDTGRVDRSDADFVDVIHSCGGVLGYFYPLGDADFYPNGGEPAQPGCGGWAQIIEACSHGRSYRYFKESISSEVGFMATECDSWDNYSSGKCKGKRVVPMGDQVPSDSRGSFYLRTNDNPPYARGYDS